MSMDSFLERMAEDPSIVLNIPKYNASSGRIEYDPLPIVVTDDSYRYRLVMGEHTLNLKFSLPGYKEIPIGTYCEFPEGSGQKYTLETPENIKKNGEANFDYDLVFQSDQFKLTKFMLRNIVPGDSRLKFSYTARPQEFLRLLVENMNMRDPDAVRDQDTHEWLNGWSFGDNYVQSFEKTVSFNHNTCADALRMIAEVFETEWEVRGKTIYLLKVEHNKENPLELSYGRGNGFLPGLGRSEFSDVKPVERLFVQGGDRNIDASSYREVAGVGSRELLLPATTRIKYDGVHFNDEKDATGKPVELNPKTTREYITDDNGLSVCRYANEDIKGLLEGSLDVSSVYPMREGTVSAADELSDGWDFWDSSIPDGLDFSDTKLRIKGEIATVIFQSGQLSGREFNIVQNEDKITGYIHNDPEHPNDPARKRGRFKLESQEIDGILMPGGSFVPVVGDKYAVFHIGMPDTYIEEAELNMLKQAIKYLYDNEMPRFTFTGTLDPTYAKRNWETIGNKIIPGGFIRFTDTQFLKDSMDIRITGIKDYVNNPHRPVVELSNNSQSGSWLHNMQRKIDSEEVATDTKDRNVVQFARRRFRDVQQTMSMLQNSLLNFTEGINPVTVNTMMMLVGEESMQFDYDPYDAFRFVPEDGKTFHADKGILTHRTMKYMGELMSWSMPAFRSDSLTEIDKGYFLYAKVLKPDAGITPPPANEFLLSETAIPMNSDEIFYYILVGILNSELDGERTFTPLNGFTEILPGRITTDRIVSEGGSFIDLVRDAVKIGGLEWNIDPQNPNTLSLFNALFEASKDGNTVIIDPSGPSIRFIDSNGSIIGGWGFNNENASVISLASGEESGQLRWDELSMSAFPFSPIKPNIVATFGLNGINYNRNVMSPVITNTTFSVDIAYSTLNVVMDGLPTSDPGVYGQVWRDVTSLKISQG